MNDKDSHINDQGSVGPPPDDELDGLLRAWHEVNAKRAVDARDRLMRAIGGQKDEKGMEPDGIIRVKPDELSEGRAVSAGRGRRGLIRRIIMNRYSTIAASLVLLAVLIPLLIPGPASETLAKDIIQLPEGGRLDALDNEGNVLGPCPLKHTDVEVAVSGHFCRVTLIQQYHNPYPDKIEAVYTFPLSHRAAVDRMTMTVGDRVVVGEVHERAKARAIYEAARDQGRVASLLEQERPNIFTQSVANIEPGARIDIEISYVELLRKKDGEYSFDFPMVVGPRYIPGSMTSEKSKLPSGLDRRCGVILLGPAKLSLGDAGNVETLGTLQTGKLQALIHSAVPIKTPRAQWFKSDSTSPPGEDVKRPQPPPSHQPTLWYRFEAKYCGDSKEFGTLHTDGTGQISGRWFYVDPQVIKDMGTGFSPDTDQVPDASRITPEPVKPGKRAGHDIAIRVSLDTGGPGIVGLRSELHKIVHTETVDRKDGKPRKIVLELMKAKEIPNRDFVLTWKQTADTIEEATFTHTGKQGNFFTLILQPPDRVADTQAVPRELIFVLDTSGSMRGFPIEKAKETMSKAINGLRSTDTFNLITFAGDTHILWNKPRPFTEQNRTEAQQFLTSRQGRGGTEMMKAINAALVQTTDQPTPITIEQLLNMPADGRSAVLIIGNMSDKNHADLLVRHSVHTQGRRITLSELAASMRDTGMEITTIQKTLLKGRWLIEEGKRIFLIDSITGSDQRSGPVRIACFMTDGYVGNDMAIIDAVKKNAHTTRVFSFGIGNSVNRYLMEGVALAGRGEVEYVLLSDRADEKVERFTKRIQTPVLTDIKLTFSDELKVDDILPGFIPDLFDVKPLIIHGRYTKPGKGTLTITGNTGAGRYERRISLDLLASQPEHDTIATLWARARIEDLMNRELKAVQEGRFPAELKQQIVVLGEKFQIMSQFTSFVAVEKMRITIGGKPRLVAVPIEMPDGVSYEGIFGGDVDAYDFADAKGELLGAGAGYSRYHGKTAGEREKAKISEVVKRKIYSGFSEKKMKQLPPPKLVRRRTPILADRPAKGGGVYDSGAIRGGTVGDDKYGTVLYSLELGGDNEEMGRYNFKAFGPTSSEMSGDVNIGVAVRTPECLIRVRDADASEVRELLKQLIGQSEAGQKSGEELKGDKDQVGDIKSMLATLKDNNALDYARKILIPERITIAIAKLVTDDKLDEARKLADALVEFDGEFRIGLQMREVLADESLEPAERDKRIAELADKARKPIDAAIREIKLRRRLEERLYKLVKGPEAAKPGESGITVTDKGILVSLLTSKIDELILEALKEAGLNIESTAKPVNLVVGFASIEKLADIALLEGVRKIDPTEFD
ncbi:MAG: VIT domain-containing protein [Planctomycetota bacterium]|jgi:hypothetical protein